MERGNKKELIKRDDLKFDFKDIYRIFMEEEVFSIWERKVCFGYIVS